jgi:hypothetical protein
MRAQRQHDRAEQQRWRRFAEESAMQSMAAKAKRESKEQSMIRRLFLSAFREESRQLVEQRAQQRAVMRELKQQARARREAAETFFVDQISMVRERAEAERRAFEGARKAQLNAVRRELREMRQGQWQGLRQMQEQIQQEHARRAGNVNDLSEVQNEMRSLLGNASERRRAERQEKRRQRKRDRRALRQQRERKRQDLYMAYR